MCGLSGIVGLNNKAQSDILIRKMNDCMAHRGPDSDGFYIADEVALGHRRLAIIDLSSAANQPFYDSTGRYVLIFNGEIYNFREIKVLLPDYPFKTSSDTEVIVAAYAKWGSGCLQYFKGMFTLAIWDSYEKKLFLARDRFGVKPLYYYFRNGLLIFASEIRAILASNLVSRSFDESGLKDYLMFQSVITPATLVRDIRQLPAGCYMMMTRSPEIVEYWNISANKKAIEETNYDQVKVKVKDLLFKSVERRLVSDVPLGVFLSGGIDSSIIAGIMSKVNSDKTNAFTIAFNEKDYDESAYAALIARKFDLNHSNVLLSGADFLNELPTALQAMDTPSGDGLNTYVVSKAIRKSGIVVAMSGVGGDELFAGYPLFRQFLQLQKFKTLFNSTARVRNLLNPVLSAKTQKASRLKNLLAARTTDISNIYSHFRQIMTPSLIKELTNISSGVNGTGDLQSTLDRHQPSLKKFESISQISIADYLGYTQHVLLKDMDQMSMASSLELREPFFDHDLVEYVLNVPDKYKLGKYPKNLLVESTAPLLPLEIIDRRKQGFVLPYDHWIRNELRSFSTERIHNLADRKLFNGTAIHAFWNQYLKKKSEIRWTDIWILIVLENWLERNEVA